jgi:hypothetical protein
MSTAALQSADKLMTSILHVPSHTDCQHAPSIHSKKPLKWLRHSIDANADQIHGRAAIAIVRFDRPPSGPYSRRPYEILARAPVSK